MRSAAAGRSGGSEADVQETRSVAPAATATPAPTVPAIQPERTGHTDPAAIPCRYRFFEVAVFAFACWTCALTAAALSLADSALALAPT